MWTGSTVWSIDAQFKLSFLPSLQNLCPLPFHPPLHAAHPSKAFKTFPKTTLLLTFWISGTIKLPLRDNASVFISYCYSAIQLSRAAPTGVTSKAPDFARAAITDSGFSSQAGHRENYLEPKDYYLPSASHRRILEPSYLGKPKLLILSLFFYWIKHTCTKNIY